MKKIEPRSGRGHVRSPDVKLPTFGQLEVSAKTGQQNRTDETFQFPDESNKGR